MKKVLAGFLFACALGACGPRHASFVKVDDVALGRVVVYRNGVAYYERKAVVHGGTLTVSVPRDKVDDFLKSLTVIDTITKQPLPVSIPREQAEDGPYLVMKLQLPSKDKAEVQLTYVTEAPAWKPSYRVVVGDQGHVMLEGWAVVDNTSGEDWKGVYVGVGSSSALSFRYDLWSVHQPQRELLQAQERFALAPPLGVSPYGGPPVENGEIALAELGDEEIRRPAGHPDDKTTPRVTAKPPAPPPVTTSGTVASRGYNADADDDGEVTLESNGKGDGNGRRIRESKKSGKDISKEAQKKNVAVRDGAVATGDAKMKNATQALVRSNKTIVIEAYADTNREGEGAGTKRAYDRANIVRNQLVDQGVAPGRIKIVTKVQPGAGERVRLVAQAPGPDEQNQQAQNAKAPGLDAQPVGESHFASPSPMTVERGSSAMVSMVRKETDGEVVYLYDAESARGNDHFAFRAVRFKNPTGSTLETGPVTVYGNERFIGEGLTEPIPPNESAVVPYALDRQIVIERNDGEENKIARLLTLQRGILTAQVQHIRHKKLTITNRLGEKAKVYIRHTVNKGWTVLDAPKQFERIGDAHLFAIELEPHTVRTIEIAESTPMERTLDLNADVTMEMMKAYVEVSEGSPELRDQLKKLLGIHKNLIDFATEQTSMRRRLADYRERMDELHAQILTLQAVKTGGELMAHLKQKMKEISERVQKTTIGLVDQEEKIMLARVQFQDALAELSLPDATAPVAAPKQAAPGAAKTKQ